MIHSMVNDKGNKRGIFFMCFAQSTIINTFPATIAILFACQGTKELPSQTAIWKHTHL